MPPPLVGRDRELGRVLDVIATGGGVRLRGDPGTGKSALLAEVAKQAEAAGTLALHAAGVEAEARMPFSGLHQLLRPVLGLSARLVEVQRQALDDAFGAAGAHPEVFLVALAALNLVVDAASERPIALLVDDAQWLDVATIEVVGFVARRVQHDPVAVIVTSRSDSPESAPLADLQEIELEGLDRESAVELLVAHFPTLNHAVRERVLDLADGNPLALLELPHALTDAGVDADVPLTRRLERSFAVRTSGLPAATRSLLLVAALDQRATLDEVLRAAATLCTDRVPVPADLAPAEALRLVVSGGRMIRFRHPLISSAIRQAASDAERRAAHAALVTALEGQPDRQVWHRAAGATGPDEALAAELEASAARLRRRHGVAQAVDALRRAADLTVTPDSQGRRLVHAAELALELGRNEEVAELLDAAEPLDLDMRTRHSLLWLREALAEASGTATVGSTVAVADQLIAAGDTRLGLQALFTAAVRCFMFKVDDSAPQAVVHAAKRAHPREDDPTFAAIRALADPAGRAGEVKDALAAVTPEALIRTLPEDAAADAMHLCALALSSGAEFRMAVGFQDRAIAAFRAQGRLGLLSRALGSHSVVRLNLGDWSLATQAADECLRLTGYVPGAAASSIDGERVLNAGSCLVVLATIAANRGDRGTAEPWFEEAVRILGGTGSRYMLALIQCARTSMALAAGRSAEAVQHGLRVFDSADPAHHWPASRAAPFLRDLADAGAATGEPERVVAVLASVDRDSLSDEGRGTFSYVDAVLATDHGDERFRAALAAAPASVVFQARLHLAYGVWLRRQRRPTDARPYLRSAVDGFDAIGAAPWAERARAELRASGEAVRRRDASERDELSPQELQIATLAAHGLTNREIAQQLFVSPRTVGSHLYRIFPKLGVRSRAELASRLVQEAISETA